MNPKKVHFWQIAGITLLLVCLVLSWQWSRTSTGGQDMMSNMMGQNMGNMMKTMHAANITLAQLLLWEAEGEARADGPSGPAGSLQWMHWFTTNVLFLCMPFILAGSVFLLIVWLN